MASFTDPSQFTMTGAYYPKGHVFAMFKDAASAHAAVESVAKQPKVGEVQFLSPEAITQAFAERIDLLHDPRQGQHRDIFIIRPLRIKGKISRAMPQHTPGCQHR